MTEKQFAYIEMLDEKYAKYICDKCDGDHSELFELIVAFKDKMTMQIASAVIDYMKNELEVYDEANNIISRGGRGSSFYERFADMDDEKQDKLMEQIKSL